MTNEELMDKYDTRKVAQALTEAIGKIEAQGATRDDYIILISKPAMYYLITDQGIYVERTDSDERLHRFNGVPIWISRSINAEFCDFVLMRRVDANPIIAMEKEIHRNESIHIWQNN